MLIRLCFLFRYYFALYTKDENKPLKVYKEVLEDEYKFKNLCNYFGIVSDTCTLYTIEDLMSSMMFDSSIYYEIKESTLVKFNELTIISKKYFKRNKTILEEIKNIKDELLFYV